MKKVLIASNNSDEIKKFRKCLEGSFDVFSIIAPDYPKEELRQLDLVLVDHSFGDNAGVEYVTQVIEAAHIPVLMLTPPDDASCAIEAIRAGAFNYIVKFGPYEEILPVTIDEAISRFNEQEKMKATIIALKKRIMELEEQLSGIPNESVDSPGVRSTDGKAKGNADIVKEIVSRFKQGEINLPSHPQINIKFQELINNGADYRQISALLKRDVAIASKLIMVSNSPFYRGVETNKTLEQAIARLGISVTCQYVNVISNRALYTVNKKKYLPMIERLWHHSLACAQACQVLTSLPDQKMQFETDPFIMGLLHDIGKLILIQVIGELEGKGKFATEISIEEVENIAEAYHSQFGTALLKRWQFSNGYTGVAQYHDNIQEADPISREMLVVHFANILVKELGFVFKQSNINGVETCESAQFLKIEPATIASMKKNVAAYMDDVGILLA